MPHRIGKVSPKPRLLASNADFETLAWFAFYAAERTNARLRDVHSGKDRTQARPHAGATILLFVARRSQTAPFTLDSIHEPRLALLDHPKQEAEWCLKNVEEAIGYYQFSILERALSRSALHFWPDHASPPFSAAPLFVLLCGLYSAARARKRSTSLRGISIRPQSEITLTFPEYICL